MTTSGFLTFVVALHQVRLSDLYVEGFVLLVLFVVDYFHLDGFTEEEEDQSRNRKEKGKIAEKECRKRKEKDRLETANIAETQPSSNQASHKGLKLKTSCDPERSSVRCLSYLMKNRTDLRCLCMSGIIEHPDISC